MKSYRLGFKAIPLFPNAGVIVVKLSDVQAKQFNDAVLTIKAILWAVGKGDFADKFFIEERP